MLNVVLFDKPMRNSGYIYSYERTRLIESGLYDIRITDNHREVTEGSKSPIIGQCTVIKNETGLYVTDIKTYLSNTPFAKYDPNWIISEKPMTNEGPEYELKPAY